MLIAVATAAIAATALSSIQEPPKPLGGSANFMGINRNLSDKFVYNAKIALKDACLGKPGESVLVR